MKICSTSILRIMFILGAVVDGAIALSWFLIASGTSMPNILNGYTGTGPDYRLAMYVAGMFMTSWTVLLAWGAMKPVERRGLLPIASVLLLLRWLSSSCYTVTCWVAVVLFLVLRSVS